MKDSIIVSRTKIQDKLRISSLEYTLLRGHEGLGLSQHQIHPAPRQDSLLHPELSRFWSNRTRTVVKKFSGHSVDLTTEIYFCARTRTLQCCR